MTAFSRAEFLESTEGSARVARRLRPLQIGVGLQNVLLWVPVEKVFMTDIGFDAAAIALVAAVYAAVVPLPERPSPSTQTGRRSLHARAKVSAGPNPRRRSLPDSESFTVTGETRPHMPMCGCLVGRRRGGSKG